MIVFDHIMMERIFDNFYDTHKATSFVLVLKMHLDDVLCLCRLCRDTNKQY